MHDALGEPAVGNNIHALVQRFEQGGLPVDLHYLPLGSIPELNPVSHVERAVKGHGYAGKKVIQEVLQREADNTDKHARGDENAACRSPEDEHRYEPCSHQIQGNGDKIAQQHWRFGAAERPEAPRPDKQTEVAVKKPNGGDGQKRLQQPREVRCAEGATGKLFGEHRECDKKRGNNDCVGDEQQDMGWSACGTGYK